MDSASLDLTLQALADRTRRGVVELLREHPYRAGELASAFDMSPPAMSRHLRTLRESGLVEERRERGDARVRVYHLRPDRLGELEAWARGVRVFWTEQLRSFRDHAESGR